MAAAKQAAMRFKACSKFMFVLRGFTPHGIHQRSIGKNSHDDPLPPSTAPDTRMDEMLVGRRQKFQCVEGAAVSRKLQSKRELLTIPL
ncbi:hypothetical protein XPR_1810 [Xanthomonas arboricola pv. pruni MAFF 301420]|uniref:Uncharacterized protein n=2 Tax=Xanthomonas arboricola pv. pruni TaxID=69929 RepID=W4RYG4_9XANT|nr:hypothetical protein XPU_0711 [Xanthomonas arboricola pv. pruni str. MAFF 311562]GAE49182.1 hypothetical protein XPU_0714 [Xanthomonas arboricola pv. pruni str. MAFF 311562]GAE55175.1 hypothetical protein XPR_1810 [Xanthomonas arboricola pv. pruni MAFF 301420]GAE62134.1 hypothetical protein XPN_4040 [Xanthomonas arboricola pv. pruni MAFF 301427]